MRDRGALIASLDRTVPEAIRESGVPGVAIAVVDGETEIIRCVGVADAERGDPVDVDTLFQCGSVTKTLTATLLQQLLEEGRLDLDAPVRTYLPELRLADESVARAVTPRHLLAHVAGFEGDVFIDTGAGDDALARYVAALADTPQVAPFDWTRAYCNAGYAILGRIVEVLRGRPFDAAAREHVLEPLGMKRTGFAWETATHAASGHVVIDGAARVVRPWRLFRSFASGGALVSTARELLAYARLHLGRREPVLSAGAVERMREPLYAPQKSPAAMAWTVAAVGGVRILTHGGSTVSHTAHLAVVPDRDVAFAVLTNADRGAPVVRAVSRAVLQGHLGLPAPAPAEWRAVPRERAAEYAGRYRAAIYEVTVGSDADGVWLEAVRRGGMDAHQRPRPEPLPRMRLDFSGDDRAVVRNGPFAEMPVWFARDRNGSVRWVRFFGRLTPRRDP